MNDTIKIILYSWMDRKIPDIFLRKVTLKGYIDSTPGKILVITGFRRCGKTYIALDEIKRLLESKSRKKVIYINFEDERIPRDEIQDMPDWSRWLRRTYDSYDMQIIVTGSSSKVSSSETPTELRGRCLEIRVYPLSFKEYLSFKGIQIDVKAAQYSENERAKTARALDDYLYYGGMPEVVLARVKGYFRALQGEER
ncbi:AAA family ATPase [Methanocella conradii]|uniref:AAA family ATPase n=1 Tax=Methanocella conradii TaxID=1175444 RepID=UPI0024B331C0|nr:AAA family ATPase [Methanocella conradii]MDI6895989.1 AAA family ATPase [Methanocella conradii]